jgi:argininosuccinate lyase
MALINKTNFMLSVPIVLADGTRAKCNKIQALPQQIMMIMNNLPSGYFRDLQIIKEVFLPAFEELEDCLQMATYIMEKIKIKKLKS